jgi:hypothetical protein
MADPDLARAGLAHLDFLPFQDLGSAGLRETNGVDHLLLLSDCWPDDSDGGGIR